MRIFVIAIVAVLASACSNGSSCLPAIPSAASCGSGIIVDASVTDPLCLSTSGLPICRGDENAICYVCSGGSFTDNCLIKDASGAVTECVHSCAQC